MVENYLNVHFRKLGENGKSKPELQKKISSKIREKQKKQF